MRSMNCHQKVSIADSYARIRMKAVIRLSNKGEMHFPQPDDLRSSYNPIKIFELRSKYNPTKEVTKKG